MKFAHLPLPEELTHRIMGLRPVDLVDTMQVAQLPMRVKFRGITTRTVALITGDAGIGEFCPFPEYSPAQAATWLASAIEAAYLGLPAAGRDKVAVNGTIPAVEPGAVRSLLDRYRDVGTLKVKVSEPGQTLQDDCARLAVIRQLRPDARLRVDANGGWTVDEAVKAAEAFGELEYMEQPCRASSDLIRLRQRLRELGIHTPVAADESIRLEDDPTAMVRSGGVDAVVLKVAPLGGVRRTLALAQLCAAQGIAVTIASALESGVGMYSGLVAASLLPSRAAGLATQTMFTTDLTAPTMIEGGCLPVTPPQVLAAAVARTAAAKDTTSWWRSHVAATLSSLQQQLAAAATPPADH
ncbi:o-succinylbenzoate synthase [Corynebacterium choanae]|uniref:Muconate cycloisomerase 1 n=1 Tax=Corynebacterium choanae TaxID=1862358 RepID=A0A3G6J8Z1_9CORY|nr:o-succinylbenzoate synthase [Corynebacterium choanae]AZA14456.1 Muconate cycloisomerase 1 [Corynebacterium choanae]